jgi:hypothetical protein
MAKNEHEIQRVEASSIARAEIDSQIATAHAYPKHEPGMLSKVKADMLTFATLDEDTAASCFYTLPRGGKAIQGPSVRTAEIAVSCYGNIRVGVRVIEIDTASRTPSVLVEAVAHDLEKNVAVSMQKRRRILKKKSKPTIDDDDINLAVNSGTAIAFRDAAFKVIPLALIKPVVAAAKKVAIGDIKSLAATRSKCVERLNKMGVPTDRILPVIGCRSIEDIGQPELEILFGLGTALKDGDTSIEDAFPRPQPEQKPGAEGLAERLVDKAKNAKPDDPKAKAGMAKKRKEKRERDAKIAKQKKALAEAEAKKKAEEEQEPEPETQDEPSAEEETAEAPGWLYVCNACKAEFDDPNTAGSGATQVSICPKCFSKNIEANE